MKCQPPTRWRASAALIGAVRIPWNSGDLYVGPSSAWNYTSGLSALSSQWGLGAAAGYRRTLGTKLAGRFEVLYRHWSGISTDELGIGVGFGVRIW